MIILRLIGKALRFWLLLETLMIVSAFYLIESFAARVRGNPKILLGTKPIGAQSIVNLWASMLFGFSTRVRGDLGRYVQRYYPRLYQLYQRWCRLFRRRRYRRRH
jgi:hypothetical protein